MVELAPVNGNAKGIVAPGTNLSITLLSPTLRTYLCRCLETDQSLLRLTLPKDGGRAALINQGTEVTLRLPDNSDLCLVGQVVERNAQGLLIRLHAPGVLERTMVVTSGKGGVGKSFISLNLAYELAALGKRVTLLDGDLTGGNLHRLLGVEPPGELADLFRGQAKVRELISPVADLFLIPGPRLPVTLTPLALYRLRAEVAKLMEDVDYLVGDTAVMAYPGTGDLVNMAGGIWLVSTPEPHAIADTYAVAYQLKEQGLNTPVYLVLNQVDSHREASATAEKMCYVIKELVGYPIEYLGAVRYDRRVRRAVQKGAPLGKAAPGCGARKDLLQLVKAWVNRHRNQG